MVTSATGTIKPSTTCCIWADAFCYHRRKAHLDAVLFSKQDWLVLKTRPRELGGGEALKPTAFSIE